MPRSKYSNAPIVISKSDAFRLIQFFFPDRGNIWLSPYMIDDNDMLFVQALILQAADASAAIGMVQALWMKAASPVPKPLGILKEVVKQVLKEVGRSKTVQEAVETAQYQMVINQIGYNLRSSWEIRIQTDDSSMLLL